jgi:hypothetical protein
MKLELTRDALEIIPESVPDEIYIETVLGLLHNDDSIPLIRRGFAVDGQVMLKLEARRSQP